MSVAQCQRNVSSREFTEWVAFDSIEGPSGKHRDDLHAAQVVQAVLAVNSTKGSPKIRLGDCVLDFEPDTRTKAERAAVSMEKLRSSAAGRNAARTKKRKGRNVSRSKHRTKSDRKNK